MRMDKYDDAAGAFATALNYDPENSKLKTELNRAVQEGLQLETIIWFFWQVSDRGHKKIWKVKSRKKTKKTKNKTSSSSPTVFIDSSPLQSTFWSIPTKHLLFEKIIERQEDMWCLPLHLRCSTSSSWTELKGNCHLASSQWQLPQSLKDW